MAELNFPSDTANGQPPAAGNPPLVTEYVAAGVTWTWNDTLGVWSSESGDITQDLDYVPNGDNAGTVTITDGTPATIPVATDDVAGLFTGAEKQKLEGIPDGGGGGETQDLSYQAYAAKGVVEITDGTNATIPLADVDSNMAGLFRADEKNKLAGIQNGATNTAYQNLGYTKNGNAAGTVTITNGNNATIPVVTSSIAGLMTGTQKQTLDGLRTNAQNDARYLRIDSAAPAQTRASTKEVYFQNGTIDIGERKGSADSSISGTPAFYVSKPNCGMTFLSLNEGQAWKGIKANNIMYGSAGSESVTLGIFRSAANTSFKNCIRIGGGVNGTVKTALLIRTASDRIRANVSSGYGLELVSKSTAGNNTAKVLGFYSKTGDSEWEAGYIQTGGQNADSYIKIKSTKAGSSPVIATITDSRAVASVEPMPSAVNAVKALRPSVLTSNEGKSFTSFPFDSTKLNAPMAVDGEETDLMEDGEPDYACIDHSRLVPLLTKALQEALERIEALEANQPAY